MEILLGTGILGIGGIGGIIGAPGTDNLGGNIVIGDGIASGPAGAAAIANLPTGLNIGMIWMSAGGRCGIITAGETEGRCAAGGRYSIFLSGINSLLCCLFRFKLRIEFILIYLLISPLI